MDLTHGMQKIKFRMGCIQSRCGKYDSLCRSKERRKLTRQVIRCRNEFAVSQIAYLQALKNTGITLKQFAEVESGDFNISTQQPPLRVTFPPPPPPPPPLSPSHTNVTPPPEEISWTDKPIQENIEIDDSGSRTPPPPSTDGAAWELWDPFALASPSRQRTAIRRHHLHQLSSNFSRTKLASDDEVTRHSKIILNMEAHESAKVEHNNMVRSLQNQEALGETSMKVEKIKTRIDELHSTINSLELAIATSLSTIAKLRDEDLHAQLVELSTGLMLMSRIMYESHQVQNHIALQLNNLNEQNHEATTEYHRMSSVQLESEATGLCKRFCNLMKAQRQYMHTLNAWMKLTSDISGQGSHADTLSFCEHWQLALDRLPDKVAADAIRSFISIIHSIAVQHAEEYSLRKKMERRDKQLAKKLKHLLFVKRASTDAFRKLVDQERDRYQNCGQATRAMFFNNLQTGLPNLFQALMGFSSVTVQAYEVLCKEG